MNDPGQHLEAPTRRPLLLAGIGVAAVLAIAIGALVIAADGGGASRTGDVVIEPASPTPTEPSLRAAAVRRTPTARAGERPSPTTEPEVPTEAPPPPTTPPVEEPSSVETPATATPAPPVAAPPVAPPPAPAGPIAGQRIYANGDSTSYFMSAGLLTAASGLGAVQVQPVPEYQQSSGLANPSYFDWYAYMDAEMVAYDPDVVVFMIGANDAAPGMDLVAYRALVAGMMDRLEGRRLIWVGQPNMGRADLVAAIPGMNAVFADEASKRPWVDYVDTWELTSDASGAYTPYLQDGTLARGDDGVHFTSAGGAYLAQVVLWTIAGG